MQSRTMTQQNMMQPCLLGPPLQAGLRQLNWSKEDECHTIKNILLHHNLPYLVHCQILELRSQPD